MKFGSLAQLSAQRKQSVSDPDLNGGRIPQRAMQYASVNPHHGIESWEYWAQYDAMSGNVFATKSAIASIFGLSASPGVSVIPVINFISVSHGTSSLIPNTPVG